MKLSDSRNILSTLLIGLILSVPAAKAGILGAENYWECILDDMQSVKNDQAAVAVSMACIEKFPDTSEPTDVSSPLFGAQTRNECFASYGKEATSFRALSQIRMACHFLYPEEADQDPGKYLNPILELAE